MAVRAKPWLIAGALVAPGCNRSNPEFDQTAGGSGSEETSASGSGTAATTASSSSGDATTGGATASGSGDDGSGGSDGGGDTTGGLGTTGTAGGTAGGTGGADSSGTTGGIVPPGQVLVPAGSFLMGCNEAIDSSCASDELPSHTVTLASFHIDETEVTRAAYQECIVAGACSPPSSGFDPVNDPDRPVRYVDWNQAEAYCAWRGFRLPTEAEWEKAARGDDGRTWPWGNTSPDCSIANHDDCIGYPIEVAQYPAGVSPYGLFDMAGNVSEWTADWYDAGYYDVSPPSDPSGPSSGSTRSIRGSSYPYAPVSIRVANRINDAPDTANSGRGFRCASSP